MPFRAEFFDVLAAIDPFVPPDSEANIFALRRSFPYQLVYRTTYGLSSRNLLLLA